MNKSYLFRLFLIFGFTSFLINQNKLNADYFFNADRIDMIQSNDSNFDLIRAKLYVSFINDFANSSIDIPFS